MKLRFTKRYLAHYRKVPPNLRVIADKKLKLLLQNPQHPSLRLHKMEGYTNRWEISVTRRYRITFQIEAGEYVLRRIGPQDILRDRSVWVYAEPDHPPPISGCSYSDGGGRQVWLC